MNMQLVGQNIILKKQTETFAKRGFSDIDLDLKIDFFRYLTSITNRQWVAQPIRRQDL